ncbi:caspase family protein [Phreatobacter oligotrophus]|uniref:Putative caspase-like protein n=1 Tax=Phreatobacter oligotrophus TaxID=1122261 RepID=A0A2T4ZHP4_9HYPH|nr:caspase family protein [Phreatobacter oligotrophus]PTM61504.1 putative caspase-like protein [Phreatobacter oligotrophus]
MSMIKRWMGLLVLALAVTTGGQVARAQAPAASETRLALVLGIGAYQTNPVPSALNDAGLVARTLRDLGFSTTEGADLPQAELRQAIASFVQQVRDAGPDAVAVVYLSGVGLQHDSDSYLLTTDAVIQRESDVPLAGIRLNDLTRALGAIPSRAKVILLDVSRQHPFADVGPPVRAGLGLLDAGPSMVIASAAAAGAVSAPNEASYGHFASALVEQLASPGLPVDQAVARARLRVHQLTNGRDTPWEVSTLTPPTPVLNAGSEATGSTPPPPPPAAARPMEGLSAQEAYALAVERDTIEGYQAFLRVFPTDPLARRVQRLLAAKREALVWRRTIRTNSPQAYWTYLRSYPRGPHAEEARLRLARLSAPPVPPPAFDVVVYDDIPPPLPQVEVVYVDDYWEPAPPAFYDEVIVAREVWLGPPVAPVYVLPPPPPPVWGVLPVVGVAALVAAPIIINRFVRPPRPPVVLPPPPTFVGRPVGFPGGRPGPGPGFTGPGSGLRPGVVPGGRPLPGSQGGTGLPPNVRPGIGGPGQRPGFVPGQGGPGAGRPGVGGPGPVVRPFPNRPGNQGPGLGTGGPGGRPVVGGPGGRPGVGPGGRPRPDLGGGGGRPRPDFGGGAGRPRPDFGGGGGRPRPNFGGGGGGPRPNFGGGGGGPRPNFGGGGGGPRPNFGGGGGGPRPNFGGGGGGPRPNMGGGGGGPRPNFGGGGGARPSAGGGGARPAPRRPGERR